MTEEWLIDGYNLLYDLKARREQSRKYPTQESLFAFLAGFSFQGRRVLFVLDGTGNDDEFRAFNTTSFHVVYSGAPSADAYIEKYLCEKKGPVPGQPKVQFYVVTKDRAITCMAHGSGAMVVEPIEFMGRVERAGREGADILFRERVKGHGFNRPFEGKL